MSIDNILTVKLNQYFNDNMTYLFINHQNYHYQVYDNII